VKECVFAVKTELIGQAKIPTAVHVNCIRCPEAKYQKCYLITYPPKSKWVPSGINNLNT
jgi:hypothetical protein